MTICCLREWRAYFLAGVEACHGISLAFLANPKGDNFSKAIIFPKQNNCCKTVSNLTSDGVTKK